MGVLDKIKQKVSDHHADAEIDHAHNDGNDPRKSEHQNWISKGQGGDRSDDHGIRAGSLTNADTSPSIVNPKVHEAMMKDEDRAGSVSQ